MKKQRHHNWKTRRVAVMVADGYHNLKLVNTKMPVRVREITHDNVVLEGPTETVTDKVLTQVPPPSSGTWDVVGVLCAIDGAMLDGRIVWVEQSITVAKEEGANLIGKKIGRGLVT